MTSFYPIEQCVSRAWLTHFPSLGHRFIGIEQRGLPLEQPYKAHKRFDEQFSECRPDYMCLDEMDITSRLFGTFGCLWLQQQHESEDGRLSLSLAFMRIMCLPQLELRIHPERYSFINQNKLSFINQNTYHSLSKYIIIH